MSFLDILKTSAPLIATALGGPAAGVAVKFLGDKLLGNPEASKEEIEHAIQTTDPITLKKIEHEFLLEKGEQVIKLVQTYTADTANAREHQVRLAQAGQNDNTKRNLSYLVIGSFLLLSLTIIYLVHTGVVDAVEAGMMGTLLGYWTAKAEAVIGYHFGNQLDAKVRDAIIGTAHK